MRASERVGLVSQAIFRMLSWALAHLPAGPSTRDRLKARVYRGLGFFFTRSPNYQAWLEAHPDRVARSLWPPLVAPGQPDWERLSRRDPRRAEAKGEPYLIVPVYRGYEETLACLYALRCTAPAARLVVVEDASPEGALRRRLQSLAREGHFELLQNARNLGFLGAVTRGLDFDQEADVVLVNSDVLVHGDWLDRLRAAAGRRPDIGTVTPLSNNGDIASYPHPQRDQQARLEMDLGPLDDHACRVNAGLAVEAPTGVGFCLYVRRACLEETGGFETSFSAGYGEENDLCLRASEAGWRHLIAADVLVRHEGARSFGSRTRRLQDRAYRELVKRHPAYPERVRDFVDRDPLREARMRLDAARLAAANRGRDAVLFVSHDWGGGVEGHLHEMSGRLRGEGVAVYVLRLLNAEGRRGLCLESAPGDAPLEDLGGLGDFGPEDLSSLVTALRILRVGHVHVHHGGSLGDRAPSWLSRVCHELGVPFDVTVHDYAAWCPRIHLEDEAGRYCGEPDEQGCRVCLQQRGSPYGVIDPGAWRDAWRVLFETARTVFCPAEDVKQRLIRYWPRPKYVVRPHPEAPLIASPRDRVAPIAGEAERLLVLVPGAIDDKKGLQVLLAAARDARARRLPLAFRVVGYTRDDAAARRAGVEVTGRYLPAQAEDVIQEAIEGACLALIPSIWPETWCSTLSLAWGAGLHPVVFDLGSQAERVRAAAHGTVLPFELSESPASLNDSLLGLREHGVRAASPVARAEYADLSQQYYAGLFEPSVPRGVVFLDRDGVINQDSPAYVRSLADWRPLPGSLEAIARLSRAGYRVVVITNQSGIARGLIEPKALEAIHLRLGEQAESLGGNIAGVYFCPHAPDAGCHCRKPATGLIDQAVRELGVDPKGAVFVGDRPSDAGAAIAVGAQPVRVGKGGEESPSGLAGSGEAVHLDLARVVDALLTGSTVKADPNSGSAARGR